MFCETLIFDGKQNYFEGEVYDQAFYESFKGTIEAPIFKQLSKLQLQLRSLEIVYG